ncbi:MAG: hypothetical protein Q8941_08880 [Bacteroidota bacterium]|nr:hypothetical protein [Bacteroidota bacterium]
MRSLYQASLDYFRKVNWTLLLFLLLVLNVKMLIKIPAIILLLVLNREMFRAKSIYRQKFIWFYFSMAGIAVIDLLLNITSLSPNHLLAVSAGIGFWLLCAAAAFLNYWFVLKTDTDKLQTTVTLFFILNAAVIICQLVFIMWDAGSVNPYTYQGMHQKYFTSTGDRMTGITFDVSTTNAILNAFGVVYFLYSGKIRFTLLCMAMLLLTTSNFIDILLVVVLLLVFIFRSTKNQKSIILSCFCLLAVFMAKVSPQNNHIIEETFTKIAGIKENKTIVNRDNTPLTEKPDSVLTTDERKQKIARLFLDSIAKEQFKLNKNHFVPKPEIPEPSIHTEPFQRKRDTTALQKKLLLFALQNIPSFDTSVKYIDARRQPGKLVAFQQTFHYLEEHPSTILTGCGIGNFASKLAFRTTGLQITGGYPGKFVYINHDFLDNHLNLYLAYFTKDKRLHSIIHSPNSVYDQLIAEYGLAGLIAFFLLYVLFFFQKSGKRSYGVPLLIILLGAFGVEYWYEQLSIVILFELLMLMHIKNSSQQNE